MYDAQSSLHGPKFAFTHDQKLKGPSTLSPGPGAYDAKDSIVKGKGASIKMGTSER